MPLPIFLVNKYYSSKFNFRWILNLDFQTGSGFDNILKPDYGSDLISKTGSGSATLVITAMILKSCNEIKSTGK